MPSRPATFIDKVPNFEARSGHMHVDLGHSEAVMPIHVCVEAVARCQRVLDDWFESQQVPIVMFPRH